MSSGEDEGEKGEEEEGEEEEGKREDDVGTVTSPTNTRGPLREVARERRAESWADLVSSSPLLSPGFAAGGTWGHDVDIDTEDTHD